MRVIALPSDAKRQQTASFLVRVNGSTYYAQNGLLQTIASNTDAAVVINAAVNTFAVDSSGVNQSGGLIVLESGRDFNIKTPIVLKWGTQLEGAGHKQAAVIRQAANWTAGRGLVEMGALSPANHVQGCGLRNVHVYGGRGTYTNGNGVMVHGSDCRVRGVEISQVNEGAIVVDGAGENAFENLLMDIQIIHADGDGVVTTSDCSDLVCIRVVVNGGTYDGDVTVTALTRYGFYNQGGSGIFYDCHAYYCTQGARLETNGFNTFIGCTFETNLQAGMYISGPDKIYLLGCRFYGNNCNARTHNFDDTEVDLYVSSSNIGIVCGCDFDDPGGGFNPSGGITRNIWLSDCTNWNIADNFFGAGYSNGQSIMISGTGSGNIVHHNQIIGSGADTPPTSIGLSGAGATGNRINFNRCAGAIVEQSSADSNVIEFNVVTGSPAITITGTNTKVRFNTGFVTENKGTATINSGSTSITINHGLGVTPVAANFWITFTENPTSDPGNIWISSITSTQATINCRNDPGASNLDLSWQVMTGV